MVVAKIGSKCILSVSNGAPLSARFARARAPLKISSLLSVSVKKTHVLTETKLIRVVELELCCLKQGKKMVNFCLTQGESLKGSVAHHCGKTPWAPQ